MNIQNLQYDVLLAPYTTFRIGGVAKYFVVVSSVQEMEQAIQEAYKEHIPWYVLGGGSDVLIADAGFDGLIIKTELREIEFFEETQQVRAGSGVLINALIQQCVKKGLSGIEFAIGVPATVGGAVWANLGARGEQIEEKVIEVTVLDEEGKKSVLQATQCDFAYRESIFKHKKYVILDTLFQLSKSTKEEMKQRVLELTQLRKKTQDIGMQCAGCVFRNPTNQTDVAAAQLIDELGLKGKQIGGAKISDVHANFIINAGDATADDVVQLISYIKQQVRDKKGIQLMEEIEYIGFE